MLKTPPWIWLLAALCVSGCASEATTVVTADTGNAEDSAESDDTTAGDSTSGDIAAGDTAAGDTAAGDSAEPDEGDTSEAITELRVEPPTQSVTIAPGETASASFQLIAVSPSGEQTLSTAAWSASPEGLGAVDATGRFTTNGSGGGLVTLTATVAGLEASATLDIFVERVDSGGGVDAGAVSALFPPQGAEGSDSALTPVFAYPEQGTHFPLGIFPPMLQWSDPYSGSPAALFKIVLTRGNVNVTIFTTGNGPAECSGAVRCHQLTTEQWRLLGETVAASGEVRVELWGRPDATAGQPSYAAAPLSFSIRPGNLAGSVYYYHVTGGAGDIKRLRTGLSDTRPVPERLFSDGACHGCHALSRDGRTIATEFASEAWPNWKTVVSDVDAAPSKDQWTLQYDDDKPWAGQFYAWGPSSQRLLSAYHDYGGSPETWRVDMIDLRDRANPARTRLGSDFYGLSHPAWSPDGGLAYFTRVLSNSGDLRIDHDDTALVRSTVTTDAIGNTSFAPPVDVLDCSPDACSYPSFSPDSRLLAYSRGELARLTNHDATATYTNRLFLIGSTADPGDPRPVALEAADTTVPLTGSVHDLQPVFSPFITPGLTEGSRTYWLVFQSLRPYGLINQDVYRHQLWVTAVDAAGVPTSDPSHPAFWLPGQALDTNNIAGYWAPNPCGQSYDDGSADACSGSGGDVDCCDGFVCSEAGFCQPDTGECKVRGESCAESSDCCAGLLCIDNTAGDSVCAAFN